MNSEEPEVYLTVWTSGAPVTLAVFDSGMEFNADFSLDGDMRISEGLYVESPARSAGDSFFSFCPFLEDSSKLFIAMI